MTYLSIIAIIVILSSSLINTVYGDNISKVEAISPSHHDKIMSFSKKGNIVILVLDQFSSSRFKTIMIKYPHLKNKFKDFTWYKNTFSSGKHTQYGEIGIHGGEYYTPWLIAKRKRNSIKTERIESWRPFVYDFTKNGYNVSLVNISLVDCEDLNFSGVSPYLCIKGYPNNYKETVTRKKNNIQLNQKKPVILSAISLFKIVPYSIKNSIYKHGTWLGTYPYTFLKSNNSTLKRKQLSGLSNLRKGDVNSNKKTFIYYHNMITHIPYVKQLCNLPSREIVSNDVCAIREIGLWLDWLKKNNIYNNTYIVLVSDHGHDSPKAMLAIKQYNVQKSLKTSTALMANFDVASFVCEIIQGCSHVKRLKNINFKQRNLFITSNPYTRNDSFNNLDFYKVNQNNFNNLKKWIKIN